MLRLELRPPELLIYALIWGFCQDGKSRYSGSTEYLQYWTGLTKRSILPILKKLTELRLIEQVPSKVDKRFVDYKLGEESSLIIAENRGRNFTEIGEETSPHNKRDISIKKENTKKEIELPYQSEAFREAWAMLVRQPKWKCKSADALRMSAAKLGKYPEGVAIAMMQQTIQNGWQGLFELKTNYTNGSNNTTGHRFDIGAQLYGEDTL